MKEKIKNFFYNQWIIAIGSPIILGLASFLFTSIKNDMSFFECIIIIFNYIKEKTIKILDYKVSIGSILQARHFRKCKLLETRVKLNLINFHLHH